MEAVLSFYWAGKMWTLKTRLFYHVQRPLAMQINNSLLIPNGTQVRLPEYSKFTFACNG